MISKEDKNEALLLIQEACSSEARKNLAADLLGLPIRTVQRWEKHGLSDHRKGSRAVPSNKISIVEREQIIDVLTSPEFGDTNPNQIVPKLKLPCYDFLFSQEITTFRFPHSMAAFLSVPI